MSKKNVLSQKKKRAAVTEENRQMTGFMGSEDEYLVIPPEMVVDGEVVAVDSIGRKAFPDAVSCTMLLYLTGSRQSEQKRFPAALLCRAWTSLTVSGVYRQRLLRIV